MKDNISFKGDRTIWIEFVNKIRKERKTVWSVLFQFIQKYLKGDKNV